jgi:hypothetical protein
MPSFCRLSRICQANICGLFPLYSRIRRTTSGVATFGFEPPIKPGWVVPNKRYLLVKEENDNNIYQNKRMISMLVMHIYFGSPSP